MPRQNKAVFASSFLLLFAGMSLRAATTDERVEALLAKMTLQEKLGQLLQYTTRPANLSEMIAKGEVGCVFNYSGAAETNAMQRIAVEQSRLKIPILFANDVIHGYRTIFPIPPAIASSWDPPSAELAAHIAAKEARAAGIRWTFAPMVDIARDPRWGRIAEGAGEDPFLGSAIAAAYVRGFQGADLAADDAVLACAKHFAGYGAAEAGRDYNSVDMSERMLREVYLPPFKAAVDAGVATIMTAFNTLNGVPSTANRHLLRTILREEWGFRGFVDSDYEAIAQLVPHGVAATPQQAALKAIQAGVDMDMVDGAYATLADAVSDGRLPLSVVDAAVRRVLRAKFAVGLFDKPYVDAVREQKILLAREHLDAARRVAQKSIILLKNEESLLPLSKSIGALAVIGPLADSKEDMLGSWHASGQPHEAVSAIEGIRAKVSAQTKVLFAKGVELEGDDRAGIPAAVETAKQADAVLLFLGEAGKGSGEALSRVSLDLTGRQQELFDAVIATGKPVALIIMSGRPLTIARQSEAARSLVWAWFPGSQGGHALADVLFGDVNPSGKLPVTIPRSVGQIPIYYAHLPTGRPADPAQKYTSKYLDSPNTPLYSFGHGLSYTTFEYGDLRVSTAKMRVNGSITVSADIRNSGKRAGDEIVQLYVNDPVASVARPVRELKGFQRISLAPGETKRVSFAIRRDSLQFWSGDGWIVEPGTFRVWIAPSSVSGVEGTFEVTPQGPVIPSRAEGEISPAFRDGS
ncbi:MAG TPA: glycoside hydrolase family 3 N-terminal domain-containing protein [Thermoanaerobaculia bacterium]|nr:glycoside hydrolase family 3 N-terminal domain-containing protein [Thermoanaerobaculia bacterium]